MHSTSLDMINEAPYMNSHDMLTINHLSFRFIILVLLTDRWHLHYWWLQVC